MAKIKVGKLREVLKQNKYADIIEIDYKGLPLEIKTYLPIQEKLSLVASIFESAIDRDNGLHILNGNSIDIAFKVLLVQTYTNLTLPKNIIESYNMLVSSGLYDFVYENIPENEIVGIEIALDNVINAERDEYEQMNAIEDRNLSIERIVKDGIDEFLIKVDELIEKLPEKDGWGDIFKEMKDSVNGLDVSNLGFLAKAISWNEGIEE